MMKNDLKVRHWLEFLAREPCVPFGAALQVHFDAGRVTRLCDCGCNSFDLEIPQGVALEPLDASGQPGTCFEVVFESNAEAEVAFLVFVDGRGYLSGLDVTCGDGNHAPLPDDVQLGRVLYAGKGPDWRSDASSPETPTEQEKRDLIGLYDVRSVIASELPDDGVSCS